MEKGEEHTEGFKVFEAMELNVANRFCKKLCLVNQFIKSDAKMFTKNHSTYEKTFCDIANQPGPQRPKRQHGILLCCHVKRTKMTRSVGKRVFCFFWCLFWVKSSFQKLATCQMRSRMRSQHSERKRPFRAFHALLFAKVFAGLPLRCSANDEFPSSSTLCAIAWQLSHTGLSSCNSPLHGNALAGPLPLRVFRAFASCAFIFSAGVSAAFRCINLDCFGLNF